MISAKYRETSAVKHRNGTESVHHSTQKVVRFPRADLVSERLSPFPVSSLYIEVFHSSS